MTPKSGSCLGSSFNVIVTVNPKASISNITNIVCSGDAFNLTPANATNTIVPSGTTYSWSTPTVTGGLTGGAPSSEALSISGTLTNPTNGVQNATYNVIPKSGSCLGSSFNVIVTIKPKPSIDPIETHICRIDTFTVEPINKKNGIVPVGTLYSWKKPVLSGEVQGGDEGLNETKISGILRNPKKQAENVVYTVTPTSNSCIGKEFKVLIVFSIPKSVIENAGKKSFCEGNSTVISIPFDSKSAYSWERDGVKIPGALSNLFQVNVGGKYTINVLDSLKCLEKDTMTIQVNPLPNTPIIYGNSKLCSNMLNQLYSTNQSSNHLEWTIDKGMIISGGSTKEALINVTAKDNAVITLKETDRVTGCSSSNKFSVNVDTKSKAPEIAKVILMGSENDFLSSSGLQNIIRWGKINKSSNEIDFYVTNKDYMDFTKIDTSNYFYFVDHGITKECFSRSFYIFPEPVTGDEELDLAHFKLYPNPASSYLNIETIYKDPTDLVIENLEGKVLYTSKFVNSIAVDVNHLLPGVYFAKMVTNSKISTYKFLKF